MSEKFNELLAALNETAEEQQILAKSVEAAGDQGDEKIEAASESEGAKAEGEQGEEGEELAKSQAAATEEVEVVEVGELIKSLHDLTGRTSVVEETLTKGLEAALGLIKGQGELIKSLQGQVTKLSGQGAGRKTVLAIHEKAPVGEPLTKSQPAGFTKEEVLAKANAAFDAKKITGLELTSLDVALRSGQAPNADVLARIV